VPRRFGGDDLIDRDRFRRGFDDVACLRELRRRLTDFSGASRRDLGDREIHQIEIERGIGVSALEASTGRSLWAAIAAYMRDASESSR